jgi:hypothetical protein
VTAQPCNRLHTCTICAHTPFTRVIAHICSHHALLLAQVGIDFDFPHFHCGYLYLTNTSCNVRVCMQAAHRVRQLIDDCITVMCHTALGTYTRYHSLSAVRGDMSHTRKTVRRLLRQGITVPENPSSADLHRIKEAASSSTLDEFTEALITLTAYNELENRHHKRFFLECVDKFLANAGYEQVEEDVSVPDLPTIALAEVDIKVAFNEIRMPTFYEYTAIQEAKKKRKATAEDKLMATKYEFVHKTLEGCTVKSTSLGDLYENWSTKLNHRTMLEVAAAHQCYYAEALAQEVAERGGQAERVDKATLAAGVFRQDLFPQLGLAGPGDLETVLQRSALEAKYEELMRFAQDIQRILNIRPPATGKSAAKSPDSKAPVLASSGGSNGGNDASPGGNSGGNDASPGSTSGNDASPGGSAGNNASAAGNNNSPPKAKEKTKWDVLRDNLNKVLYASFGVNLVKVDDGGDRRGTGTTRASGLFHLKPSGFGKTLMAAGLLMGPTPPRPTGAEDSDDDPLA